jgi:hypothetical protein
MRSIYTAGLVSAIALSALVSITSSAAEAGPIVPPGHYCLAYDHGGSDCSFTSYAQCQATASGIDAECYGKTVQDEEHSRNQSRHGYNSRAQIH